VNLQPLFQPKNMAVVGVSKTNDRHPANVVYNKNHLRYSLNVFPVNPKGGNLNRETIYPRIGDIPEKIDLAVIAVRAEQVPDVVGECIEADVGGAVVISGGFAETGRKDLQDRLASIAIEADFPVIGPNCLGIYAPGYVDSFFLPIERMVRPEPGNVAVVSQSGGILVDQMLRFADEGVGLSLAVSIGNKAMIREIDLLRYLIGDPNTKVIAFYVEGFEKNEGRKFVLAADQCLKPVIMLKAGKSPEGASAVSSHTASLAGDYKVFSEVLSQFSVVEAKNDTELISFCESLSCYQQPIQGRVGIITGSGGHGAMAVDACVDHGITVPVLSEKIQEEIRMKLAPSIQSIASVKNPIDLTGSAVDEDFAAVARILSETPEIDCVVMLLLPYLPGITSDLGAMLSQVFQRAGKPLIAYVPHVEKYMMLIEGFELNRVPVSLSIEGAILMVEAMRRFQPC
jgi:acetyltransferase